LFLLQVVQASFAVGAMNAIVPGTRLSIMDQFFLGGPLTLRGFNIKGVGPHEDGLFVSSIASRLVLYFYILLVIVVM